MKGQICKEDADVARSGISNCYAVEMSLPTKQFDVSGRLSHKSWVKGLQDTAFETSR